MGLIYDSPSLIARCVVSDEGFRTTDDGPSLIARGVVSDEGFRMTALLSLRLWSPMTAFLSFRLWSFSHCALWPTFLSLEGGTIMAHYFEADNDFTMAYHNPYTDPCQHRFMVYKEPIRDNGGTHDHWVELFGPDVSTKGHTQVQLIGDLGKVSIHCVVHHCRCW